MQADIVLRHNSADSTHYSFMRPDDMPVVLTISRIMSTCETKYDGNVHLIIRPPYKVRSTGKDSQNHKLNAMIVEVCNYTGQDYDAIKYCIKMIAVEHLEYPYTEMAGHIMPKPEHECDTEECSKLIEAAYMFGASIDYVYKE